MPTNAQLTEIKERAELLRQTHERNAAAHRTDEFRVDAAVWPADLSRRRFIQLMGASVALAGLGGCNRMPSKEIVPYTLPPEAGTGAEALFYATAFPWEGFARGLLVAAHSGRPTKIEGNPAHPESLGATDIFTQASVLSLYDPDRSQTPRHQGNPSSWQAFEDAWAERRGKLLQDHGRGLALLTEPTTSPTFLQTIHRLLEQFPEARWYQSTPLPRYDRDGAQLDYDFQKADVIFSIESDILVTHPAAIRYSRAFAERRRVVNGRSNPTRLYALESSPTHTGSLAAARLPASPLRWPAILRELGSTLGVNLIEHLFGAGHDSTTLSAEEKTFVENLSRDFRAKAPGVLCVVDPSLPDAFHVFADTINRHFNAYDTTVHALAPVRSDGDTRANGGLSDLIGAIDASEVNQLVILDSNPVYTASNAHFAERLRKLSFAVHLGCHFDETAELCEWHLPQNHFLESWGDLRAYDGTISIQQPLIEPLYKTISAIEFLQKISPAPEETGYDLVRAHWALHRIDFGPDWRRWLDRGVVPNSAEPRVSAPTNNKPSSPYAPVLPNGAIAVVFKPDPTLSDGRWANHGWLQELPKPFTHLVWDNAALISPGFAKKYNLENRDEISLHMETGPLLMPVWIVPGHADDCVTLHLGSGRSRVGTVGTKRGVDVYPFLPATSYWLGLVKQIEKTGQQRDIASTHDHFSMQSRETVRVVALADLAQVKREEKQYDSMYPKVNYISYAWGMSIDLNTCTGCNACVIACQAENNIPVVGKEQVMRGREMHWIRIDRYYEGDPANPQILQQPVPCMQCENAPCELVCPVGATVHSSEGLNDMVYNRCVGTRYCSNNCPYKVRRFNFFDFRQPLDSPEYLQANPNVTVRSRGVMEKCTYCVQRINAARIRAEREVRKIRDGEVLTACQQACPVEAIIFGDLSDPKSRVVQRKRESTDYALLEELNTRPRTTYLARIADETSRPLTGGAA
jgi:molybdopterin-containing oxidoreductase family iron-sulfur binding subunit